MSVDAQRRETATAALNASFTLGDGSFSPSISADGRFVAFSSAAGDLVLGDTSSRSSFRGGFADEANSAQDIFIKDLKTGAITRASFNDDDIKA